MLIKSIMFEQISELLQECKEQMFYCWFDSLLSGVFHEIEKLICELPLFSERYFMFMQILVDFC